MDGEIVSREGESLGEFLSRVIMENREILGDPEAEAEDERSFEAYLEEERLRMEAEKK